MRIDFATLAFGYTVTSGGNTPNWATSLGQSKAKNYRINENAEINELLKGMVYKSVSLEKIKMKKGRGGAYITGTDSDSPFVLASVFSKVYINEALINGGKFGLVIIRDDSESHKGRLILKYAPSITYTDGTAYTNEMFYSQVRQQLGLADNACWFVYEIVVRNQDELVLKTVIVNSNGPETYSDANALHSAWDIDITVNNEEEFKEWFKLQTHDDGKPYTDSTRSNYIGSVKNASNKLRGKFGTYESIFNINSVTVLDRIVKDVIEKDELLPELLSYGANALMPCLNLYRKFLSVKDMAAFEIIYNTNVTSSYPLNRIIFGAPGTGKSHLLKEQQKDLVGDTNNFERVTFHPDYTYANFVGTYKPVPAKDEAGKDIITYKYIPGPFMRMLVKALLNSEQAHLLIIEEINRANVAAVFGDVFQLLDRDAKGVSEYAIQTSEDMRKYLSEALNIDSTKVESIKIPNNLFLWATMNSADQGVYPMDTAFKRRWGFEYIDIDNNDKDINHYWFEVAGVKLHWNSLRKAINKELTDNGINEDKLMGAFFVSKNVIDENNNEKFVEAFCNKVIMYLFEDAVRQKPGRIFKLDNNKTRYSALCKDFEKNGINIFVANIVEEYKKLAETQVTTTNQEQTVETAETVE